MSDTVLVTGGLGRSGRWLVDRIAAEGDEVVCVDQSHPGWERDARAGVTFRAADLTDRGETFELVGEVDPDSVVHWAAIPAPERHAGGRVFENNVAATYAVLVAAGRAGARVVQASSESAYGFPFSEDPVLPDELPVTESHAFRPEDPYGTSKVVAEDLAGMVTRRFGVPVVSVRPSWIQYPGEYNCLGVRDDLAAGHGNCWSYVDVRDVAGVVTAALSADVSGHEPVHAVASENYMDRPTVDLVREFFGEVPDRCDVEGDEAALSTARMREVLGYEPEHSWRDAADADVAGPELVRDR